METGSINTASLGLPATNPKQMVHQDGIRGLAGAAPPQEWLVPDRLPKLELYLRIALTTFTFGQSLHKKDEKKSSWFSLPLLL